MEPTKNGTYAILAAELLCSGPDRYPNKILLWKEIQRIVRRELNDEPALGEAGAVGLAFQLYHLGLIVGVWH